MTSFTFDVIHMVTPLPPNLVSQSQKSEIFTVRASLSRRSSCGHANIVTLGRELFRPFLCVMSEANLRAELHRTMKATFSENVLRDEDRGTKQIGMLGTAEVLPSGRRDSEEGSH